MVRVSGSMASSDNIVHVQGQVIDKLEESSKLLVNQNALMKDTISVCSQSIDQTIEDLRSNRKATREIKDVVESINKKADLIESQQKDMRNDLDEMQADISAMKELSAKNKKQAEENNKMAEENNKMAEENNKKAGEITNSIKELHSLMQSAAKNRNNRIHHEEKIETHEPYKEKKTKKQESFFELIGRKLSEFWDCVCSIFR